MTRPRAPADPVALQCAEQVLSEEPYSPRTRQRVRDLAEAIQQAIAAWLAAHPRPGRAGAEAP